MSEFGTTDPAETTTGHPRVDEVIGELSNLADHPVSEHTEILSVAHERLHSALDEHRGSEDQP